MWYWREQNFTGLRELAARMAGELRLTHFSDYCSLRERGLRKEAFASLGAFLEITRCWSVEERREFVQWLVETHISNPAVYDLMPHPLHSGLVVPTIAQWQAEAPHDPVPFRLGGDRKSLNAAVKLDPTHQGTVLRLVKLIRGAVAMACHELPSGIIGEADDVLIDLDEIERLSSLIDPSERELFERVSEHREVVQNYAMYLQGSDRSKGFENWAKARGLKCNVN